jgi:hypothetical protein
VIAHSHARVLLNLEHTPTPASQYVRHHTFFGPVDFLRNGEVSQGHQHLHNEVKACKSTTERQRTVQP